MLPYDDESGIYGPILASAVLSFPYDDASCEDVTYIGLIALRKNAGA